jgi:hypothetical protein
MIAISHYFVMDWASVWLDIVGGETSIASIRFESSATSS